MANNTGRKTNSKSASKKNTKANASAKSSSKARSNSKEKKYQDDNRIKEIDPYFNDVSKDIILIICLAIGILLFISNLNMGGTVGGAISGVLFGIFGIIQYVLPIMIVVAAFFIVSNYENIVAKVKTAFTFVFAIFVSVLAQLIVNGDNVTKPIECFNLSRENHYMGGFLGGGIAYWITEWFGKAGAFIVVIVAFLICAVAIFEKFMFASVQKQSQMHADRAAIKRRERRERQELERQSSQAIYQARIDREREKIKDDYERQVLEAENSDGARRDRKRSGITFNTSLSDANIDSSDSINEIRINASVLANEPVVETTTRSKLKSSDRNSKSKHSFSSNEAAEVATQPVLEETYKEIKTEEPVVINEPVRKPKPSVVSTQEKESEAENLRKSIESTKSKTNKSHKFPPITLLNQVKNSGGDSNDFLREMAGKLERTLKNFGVDAKVTEVTPGPSVTRYEISIAEGTRVTKVVNLADDIKLSMAVTDVRIEAPIPGKSAIGIEVPNKTKSMVSFRELADSAEFKNSKSKLSFCVGKDIGGNVIVGNIEKMPHLLIAGATGSGKSVCINTIIMSILYHASPEDVKLIMVDPKMVELTCYNGIPHLLLPVITDPKKAAGALHWAVKEMTDRYELLAKVGVRNLEGYNEKFDAGILSDEFPDENLQRMNQIVIILDELADLMMVAASDVEDSIVRLAQLARAAGIHLIIATQRPTANVITGLIKANVPSRIAFSVASGMDSRVILDETGAENLLGNGDMLYAPQNLNKPIRVQGAFVSDEEVGRVVDFLKANNDPPEDSSIIAEQIEKSEASTTISTEGDMDNSRDTLFVEAGKLVIENQKGSIGYLQRNFRIGFNRAARIMDQLCEYGVVGPEVGTKPREIKMSLMEFEDLINNL